MKTLAPGAEWRQRAPDRALPPSLPIARMSDIPPTPPPSAEHVVRRAPFDREQRFTVAPDALVVATDGFGEERIPLADVRHVHLGYRRKEQRDLYECRVTLQGGRELFIHSRHWRGSGDFEDRTATYAGLVYALHHALLPYRDQVLFRSGSRRAFAGALAGTAAAGSVVVGGLVTGYWPFSFLAAGALAATSSLLPKTRPRVYLPEAPPPALLPSTPADSTPALPRPPVAG